MFCTAATAPGDPNVPNEDWYVATPDLLVVLDGATIRTDTGCVHGAAWYTQQLGAAIAARAPGAPTLTDALTEAIDHVGWLHRECDLTHPGTPSAAVAVIRRVGRPNGRLQYLVLGDVTAVIETAGSDERAITVVSDPRVSATAAAQRAEADRHPIGSPEKAAALLGMKRAELAARNTDGGYWIAAADHDAAHHALIGQFAASDVQRIAVMTDGAARFVDLFQLGDWGLALDYLSCSGPTAVIDRVRAVETHDPDGVRYPRNKVSDDATVVYTQPVGWLLVPPRPLPPERERRQAAQDFLDRTVNAPGVYGDGNPAAPPSPGRR